ncbi:hypothetical protein NVP1201B_03 [Vibrio phage 1.201.B._10N.286.55.F1]|nr:hypothetical protein NVP1201B_03 [Vibrio phage 1.201.B._10N.286.55.F1]
MALPKTKEWFIERSIATHGATYDYSLVDYKNSQTKVTIICKTHGAFTKSPSKHIIGQGCQKCAFESKAKNLRRSKDDILCEFKRAHGDRYIYNMNEYVDTSSKITITCKIHGDFLQAPHKHIAGNGCNLCGNESISSSQASKLENVISKFISIHGDKYDYSRVLYKNAKTKVEIKCKFHGLFLQEPDKHLHGNGCPSCANEKRNDNKKISIHDFISRSKAVHREVEFDYSIVDYKNNNTKVKIICPIHGVFEQVPASHLVGNGCPNCAKTGFNSSSPAFVYVLVSTDEGAMKIGITNSIKNRTGKLSRNTPFEFDVLSTRSFALGSDAQRCEKDLHSMFSSCGFYGFDGATEWFKYDGRIADILSEWKRI